MLVVLCGREGEDLLQERNAVVGGGPNCSWGHRTVPSCSLVPLFRWYKATHSASSWAMDVRCAKYFLESACLLLHCSTAISI